MHDIMTGFYEPNSYDAAAGIDATFGATTNVINGGQECGAFHSNGKAESRGDYYASWLDFFGLPAEDADGLTCEDQDSGFPNLGAGDLPGYWERAWDGRIACLPVSWMTEYSITTRDDYKRCICNRFGSGAVDCATDED